MSGFYGPHVFPARHKEIAGKCERLAGESR